MIWFCDCLELCVTMLQDCYFIMFKVLIVFLKLYAKFCSLETKYNICLVLRGSFSCELVGDERTLWNCLFFTELKFGSVFDILSFF